jgi:abortive infection bacteriophage resistance protein
MRYGKLPLTYEEQFDLLEGRGLIIEDRIRAIRWLKHVSYYRLSAYFIPFKTGDQFNAGSTFNRIAGMYIFDRKLRLVLLDAIERIEVALRTALTYEIAHHYGPFGHIDSNNFSPHFNHSGFMQDLKEAERDSKETFVTHFRGKYTSEPQLPLWMASELLSFGMVSRLYGACSPLIKRKLAARYNIRDIQLASWFHALSYVRNVCAHHSRLWNRRLAVKPSIPNLSRAWLHNIPRNDSLYAILVIVRHCLLISNPSCMWKARLFQLFDSHPEISLDAMGIPADWRSVSPWV